MKRTIGTARPVGPAGYGAAAQAIMDDVQRRTPGAFMGNERAQEALAVGAARGVGDRESALDTQQMAAATRAIQNLSRSEANLNLQRTRLENAKAAAGGLAPTVSRLAGAIAPALALGTQIAESRNTPAARALRAAQSAQPDSSLPMMEDISPEDLETLQAMSQPMQADETRNVVDQITSEVDRVEGYLDTLRELKDAAVMPQSVALDELYEDRRRERRRQLLESEAVRALRRDLADMPVNPYLEGM